MLDHQTVYETQLFNHLNNLAEFAKLNDINTFDQADDLDEDFDVNQQFLRGLLMNLELLSDKWGLIDRNKYKYR